MSLDRTSPGGLVDYHKYRKKMRHLYICTECAKGFDRERPASKCAFCGGVIKELERDDISTAKQLYRYTCPSCDKIFIAEHAEKCIKCGGKFLHFYEVSKLNRRDIFSMRKGALKEKIKKLGKRKK